MAWKPYPKWILISVVANGIVVVAILVAGSTYAHRWLRRLSTQPTLASPYFISASVPFPTPTPIQGERVYLNYQQWVDLLAQEADAVAQQQPDDLYIMLGDSISMWFPNEILPPGTWLNQGISGDTSVGVLRRLELLDKTQPKAIFLMIGINDLLRGVPKETIIANQRLTIRYLQRMHPDTVVVVQSILPHSAEAATWEGREKLLEIPNTEIREINQQLARVAETESAVYLDLYRLFADEQGNLRTELSTDGLHLNTEGYKLWRVALDICKQLEID
jgi:lysophospholipase L1-like esterase